MTVGCPCPFEVVFHQGAGPMQRQIYDDLVTSFSHSHGLAPEKSGNRISVGQGMQMYR
jgi:hypothetical protein